MSLTHFFKKINIISNQILIYYKIRWKDQICISYILHSLFGLRRLKEDGDDKLVFVEKQGGATRLTRRKKNKKNTHKRKNKKVHKRSIN